MQTRTIGARSYELVKTQRSGACVYRGERGYLRAGPPGIIAPLIASHRYLESYGFPVPHMTEEGTDGTDAYFVEESLGEVRLIDAFAEDIDSTGSISDQHMSQFIDISAHFLRAQLRSPAKKRDRDAFAHAVHLELIVRELSQHADAIRRQFDVRFERLAQYPFRIMHADLNPANMYPHGVIDFEDVATGPVGYDTMTAIGTAEWFPRGDYEFQGKYRYSGAQYDTYVRTMDDIMQKHALPPVSAAADDLLFFRAMWHTVRMHEWPKLQKYRYDRFTREYLS